MPKRKRDSDPLLALPAPEPMGEEAVPVKTDQQIAEGLRAGLLGTPLSGVNPRPLDVSDIAFLKLAQESLSSGDKLTHTEKKQLYQILGKCSQIGVDTEFRALSYYKLKQARFSKRLITRKIKNYSRRFYGGRRWGYPFRAQASSFRMARRRPWRRSRRFSRR